MYSYDNDMTNDILQCNLDQHLHHELYLFPDSDLADIVQEFTLKCPLPWIWTIQKRNKNTSSARLLLQEATVTMTLTVVVRDSLPFHHYWKDNIICKH